MHTEQTVRGDEFDSWMGENNESARSVTPDEKAAATEVKATKRRQKPVASPGTRKKKLLIVAGLVGLAVLAATVVALVSGQDELGPPSDQIAAVIERAKQPPPAPAAAAPAPAPVKAPVSDADVAGAPEATLVAANQEKDEVAAHEIPAEREQPKEKDPPVSKTEREQLARKAASQAVKITELQNDLYRAKQRAKAAKAAASASKYTLVAVLADGAVVRDEKGHERVIAVGGSVGK